MLIEKPVVPSVSGLRKLSGVPDRGIDLSKKSCGVRGEVKYERPKVLVPGVGAVAKSAMSSAGREIDLLEKRLAELREQFKTEIVDDNSKPLSIKRIQHVVSEFLGIPMGDLLAQRRDRKSALARQIAMYLCKTLTLKSLPEIGRRFGGRDHTTILYGVRKIEKLIGEDEGIRATITALSAALRPVEVEIE